MAIDPHKNTLTKLTGSLDVDTVVDIWIEGSKAAHHFIGAAYWRNHAKAMKEMYIPQSETWIYRNQNSKIAGFISLVENHLAALFVHPEQQDQGIGSKLIERAKELRNELHLRVYVKNNKAVRFYLKHQFRIKRTRVDENTGEEEYYMVWNR
jgi:putative acetyltransferase